MQLEELNIKSGGIGIDAKKSGKYSKEKIVEDPIDIERREKVKEAMIHAWSSYEKYAWGQDELQVVNHKSQVIDIYVRRCVLDVKSLKFNLSASFVNYKCLDLYIVEVVNRRC